jgi:predicted membrane chloride channel (bestrophin family)
VVADSWQEVAIVAVWGGIAIVLHEILSARWLAMPILPVAVISIAVSFYLGVKIQSTYERW